MANIYGRKVSSAYIITFAEANEIVDSSQGLALGPCTCRTVFHRCNHPINTEIMLAPTGNVFIEDRPNDYREISKEEARGILAQCHRSGLVHTIVKCRENLYAICNCCACCCVPLRLSKKYGIGRALNRTDSIVREFREQVWQVDTESNVSPSGRFAQKVILRSTATKNPLLDRADADSSQSLS
ncbi:MAG: ferredoxin-like protein [Chloroflexi bacterium]|nr:ferredoxin-like protein [Chloroflexota bacterium]